MSTDKLQEIPVEKCQILHDDDILEVKPALGLKISSYRCVHMQQKYVYWAYNSKANRRRGWQGAEEE